MSAPQKGTGVTLKSITRSLPVQLTNDELRAKGSELAAVIQDVKGEEDRQADLKAQMKARLTELDARAMLVHCSQEMTHLATFLPALYEQES